MQAETLLAYHLTFVAFARCTELHRERNRYTIERWMEQDGKLKTELVRGVQLKRTNPLSTKDGGGASNCVENIDGIDRISTASIVRYMHGARICVKQTRARTDKLNFIPLRRQLNSRRNNGNYWFNPNTVSVFFSYRLYRFISGSCDLGQRTF